MNRDIIARSVNKKTGVSYLRCRDKIAEKCDARAILFDESGIIKSVNVLQTYDQVSFNIFMTNLTALYDK